MKVAIVHDYLIDFGGAERVLLALHEIFPEAPVYTAIVDPSKIPNTWKNFSKLNIKTSWFNYLPFKTKLISPLRFLLPLIWGKFDLGEYDLIIDSSAWAITRGFKKNDKQIEICYCHTPPRYLYGFDTSRNWQRKWFGGFIKIYASLISGYLKRYDFEVSQRVDHFIANSENVRKRIQKFYKRDSVVIYPPVDVALPNRKIDREDYFLTGGRFVVAKNFDLIIKACEKAKVTLKIFGSGILEDELKSIAGDKVEFLGNVNDMELFEFYAKAKGFIVAQKDEDFGMTTVEAQATGCPVVAYKGGGYLESVVDGKTGIFFEELNSDSLVKALKRFEKKKWHKNLIKTNAERFSKKNFKKEMLEFVERITNHA
jgi:glycosyltransferase involved in cell wall biosynthesis